MTSRRTWTCLLACGALAGCGITIPGNLDLGIDPSLNGAAGRGGSAARGGGIAGAPIGTSSVAGTRGGWVAGAWGGAAGDGAAGVWSGYAGYPSPPPPPPPTSHPYDLDGDGYNEYSDCNDTDWTVHPNMLDACCDGRDSDCDGRDSPAGAQCKCATPETDFDGDGYPSLGGDCDDRDPTVNPGTFDRCRNGRDDDCDGFIDEANADCYRSDADGDGCPSGYDCDDSNPMFCTVCPFENDRDADGFPTNIDCDDGDPTIFPKAMEVCGDGRDNDCDGVVDGYPFCDSYIDWDRDGYPAAKDCNDGDATVFPGSPYEICCDNIDSNCDGWEGISNAICTCPVANDRDGDGYGIGMSDPALADCNDQNANIHPNAVEFCADGVDNDCDGSIDNADSECVVIID